MRQFIRNILLLVLLGGASCSQTPDLPNSLIPAGCRLGLATYTYEGYSDSTAYEYDSFGHLTKTTATRKERGRVTRQISQFFGFGPDHYLNSRTDRITTYTNSLPSIMEGAFVYEYQGTPKQIQSIRRISGTVASDSPWTTTYQYTGTQLSQYREVAASGTLLTEVSVGPDGRPTRIQQPRYQLIDLANGLIRRTVNGKDTTQYTYDAQGQLTNQIISYGGTGERVERTITYDNRIPVRTGELRFKGFPENDLTGNGRAQSNIQTETIRRFRSGFLIESSTLQYSYAYNSQNYPTGYARSDGSRARFYYTNCP
ncbi:hypothetical protein [Rudanella lutea]|uniref:hypothetical protein n=1 Tax=Rudanella lutea TaxID=451374 RepID=UPI00039FE5BF|nr:hypothetical protein [Rudanella lutea]